MSAIVKTEAVVLRSIDFRESSNIVTFYTRQFGKIAGIVKGARQPKSKYGSSLEPMSYVLVVFYKKENRDIQTVSHCDLMKPFKTLYEDLDKMAVGMAMIELVNIVTHEHEQNVPLFTLITNCLNALNTATKNPTNLLHYFELHLARTLGFQLTFDHCVSCQKMLTKVVDNHGYRFNIERGGLVCSKCSNVVDQRVELSSKILRIFLEIFSSNDIDIVTNYDIEDESRNSIGSFLWMYLQFHVTGLRSLKSEEVFAKILLKT